MKQTGSGLSYSLLRFAISSGCVSMAIVLTAPFAWGQGATCEVIYRPPQKSLTSSLPQFINELPADLLALQRKEAEMYSPKQIKNLNDGVVRELEAYIPEQNSQRAGSISMQEVSRLLDVVRNHPVVAPQNRKKYEPENVEIGYCFGRAAYLHLMMLKMGLSRSSVVKIWAVGEQSNPGSENNWGHHVATAVYVRGGWGWMTVDTNSFKIQPIRHWVDGNMRYSLDQKLRIYVSPASRFALQIPKYDRLQMGLDLNRENDWYRGYFTDLLKSVREEPLASLGLKEVEIVESVPKEKPKGVWGFLTDYFGT